MIEFGTDGRRNREIAIGRLLVGTAVLAISIPGEASAQSGAATGDGFTDIVVTAQRRESNAQQVPASIVAATGDQLIERNINGPADLGNLATGLQVGNMFGDGAAPTFTMRGITASDFSQNQSRPIALYLNESIRGLNAFEFMQFYDLERVEVLKGPQGTLYGKNATGGAINVITRKASFNTDGYVTASYGNFDRKMIEGAFGTTVIPDMLAVRAAVQYIKADGYLKSLTPQVPDGNSTDLFSGRLSFHFQPSSIVEADLVLHHLYSKSSGALNYQSYLDPSYAPFGGTRAGLSFYENNPNRPGNQVTTNKGVNLTVAVQANDHTITSITSYDRARTNSRLDQDSTPLQIDENEYDSHDIEQVMQELRMQSSYGGPLNWLAGLFYSWDTATIQTTYNMYNDPRLLGHVYDAAAGTFGFNEFNSFTQQRTSYAGYARAEYEPLEKVRLSAGMRYSHDRFRAFDYEARIGGTPPGGAPQYDTVTFSDQSIQSSSSNLSVEAGLEYRPLDRVLLYANFRQGYRSGAINAQAFLDPAEITTVRPEKVNSYEIGAKATISDHVRFNTSAFIYDYSDQQFIDTIGPLYILKNAEKSRVIGVEWDLNVKPVPMLNLSTSGSYLDASYTSLSLGGRDLSGNRLIGSARWNLKFAADLKIADIGAGRLSANISADYNSRIFYDAANKDNVSGRPYWLTNGRIGYNTGKGIEISVWGQNLLGERYFVYGYDTVYFGYGLLIRGRPRSYGLDVTYRF